MRTVSNASNTEAEPLAAEQTDLLFINYASEDNVFAEWLERKLVALGYAVWRDKSQMFGGESWPKEIGLALPRSYRMLSIISSVSLEKDLPLKERTSAASMGRKRGIDDFVIPLVIDGTSLNWTLSDNVPIEFHDGRLNGLRQLLKKLEKIDAPKSISDGPTRAVLSMSPDGLVKNETEELRLNVLGVESVGGMLRSYWLPLDMKPEAIAELRAAWPHYPLSEAARRVLALCPPPAAFADIEHEADEWQWEDFYEIQGIKTSNIITSLLKKSLYVRLRTLGFKAHLTKENIFYLEPGFTENGWVTYLDPEGKSHRKRIRGYKTIYRAGQKQKVFYHFAMKVGLGSGVGQGFFVQLSPSLFFFDEEGNAIVDKRVNQRRKAITKSWYNDEWFARYQCAEQLLLTTDEGAVDGIKLSSDRIWLTSPVALVESALAPVKVDADEEGGEVVDDTPESPFDDED